MANGARAGSSIAICAFGVALTVFFQVALHSYIRGAMTSCFLDAPEEWAPGGSALARLGCVAAMPLEDANIGSTSRFNVASHVAFIDALLLHWAVESTKSGEVRVLRVVAL
jgi:hypothetical protein